MIEYIKCSLFFILFIVGLYIFGSFLSMENESWSKRFVKGYFVYSFFVAIFGIVIQVLNLSWKIFEFLMFGLIFSIIIYCLYCYLKKRNKITNINMFIKENWFLIVLTLFLMFLTCFHYIGYWFNNHLDDGYYINKVAMFPYVSNPFRMIPSTGFNKVGIDSYILNTYELEASFFVYILKTVPTLYCRFFLAGFNYFLLVNILCLFNEKLSHLINKDTKLHFLQYTTVIVLFFAFDERFLNLMNISLLKDSNQFCNAMYYGSSLVRTASIMILLCPLIDRERINYQMILEYFIISVVLISKSSIALPIIIAVAISYLIVHLFKNGSVGKRTSILLVLLLLISNLFFYRKKTKIIISTATSIFTRNILLIGVLPIFVLFVIMMFLHRKNDKITKLNAILTMFFIITTVPIINTFISKFSFYGFVVERTFTCLYYTLVSLVFFYICHYIFNSNKKIICHVFYSLFIGTTTFALGFGDLYSLSKAGGSIFSDVPLTKLDCLEALEVIRYNNKFIPNCVLRLGETLTELENKSNQDLNVLSREYHTIDSQIFTLAASLTSVAPKVKSISAKFRYGGELEDNPFYSFSSDDQYIFEQFLYNYNENTLKKFKKLINKYPINCVILTVIDREDCMSDLGFKLYKKIYDPFEKVEFDVYVKMK